MYIGYSLAGMSAMSQPIVHDEVRALFEELCVKVTTTALDYFPCLLRWYLLQSTFNLLTNQPFQTRPLTRTLSLLTSYTYPYPSLSSRCNGVNSRGSQTFSSPLPPSSNPISYPYTYPYPSLSLRCRGVNSRGSQTSSSTSTARALGSSEETRPSL